MCPQGSELRKCLNLRKTNNLVIPQQHTLWETAIVPRFDRITQEWFRLLVPFENEDLSLLTQSEDTYSQSLLR